MTISFRPNTRISRKIISLHSFAIEDSVFVYSKLLKRKEFIISTRELFWHPISKMNRCNKFSFGRRLCRITEVLRWLHICFPCIQTGNSRVRGKSEYASLHERESNPTNFIRSEAEASASFAFVLRCVPGIQWSLKSHVAYFYFTGDLSREREAIIR